MKSKSVWHIPLVVTVGQVAIFPYYIVWLKEASMTFTLFAWIFAVFSFSAAWGYRVFQSKKSKTNSYISLIYMGMGLVYILVGFLNHSFDFLPYTVVLLQIILGFLQGYFRAWHIEQKTYRLHAVNSLSNGWGYYDWFFFCENSFPGSLYYRFWRSDVYLWTMGFG